MSRRERKARRNLEKAREESLNSIEVESVELDIAEIELPEPLQLATPTPLDPTESKAWRLTLPFEEIVEILKHGTIGELRLVPWGSNYTFIAPLCDERTGNDYAVIYKPMRGEAPLWDFASHTLYQREFCAYLVSFALDWHFIPPVVIREGQHGVGTVQLFIDMDETADYYDFRHSHAHELKRFAIFDYITNNADRKAGHCLLGQDGWVWAIDHGLCFNHVPKLRTIIWDFAGEEIPQDIIEDLKALFENPTQLELLVTAMSKALQPEEIEPFIERARQLIQRPVFPSFQSRRQVPWGFF